MCVDVSFDAWMLWQMAVLVKIKLCAETALYLATEVYIDICTCVSNCARTYMHASFSDKESTPTVYLRSSFGAVGACYHNNANNDNDNNNNNNHDHDNRKLQLCELNFNLLD